MDAHLNISVVVATYNRKELLTACLTALSKQTAHRFNLIIINDGGTAIDENAIKAMFNSLPAIKVTLVNNSTNAGSAIVRNQGFRLAPNGIVAFTDDDALPDPTWLQEFLNYFESYPRTTAVNGYIGATSLRRTSERLRQAYYDYRDTCYSNGKRNASFRRYLVSSSVYSTQNLTDWISLGNCAIRKSSGTSAKPLFDTNLTRNYSHKLAKQLLHDGKIIAYSKKPRIKHAHGRDVFTLLDIRRRNGTNFCIIDNSNQTSFRERTHECFNYLHYMFFRSKLKPHDKLIEAFLSILFITFYSVQLAKKLFVNVKA